MAAAAVRGARQRAADTAFRHRQAPCHCAAVDVPGQAQPARTKVSVLFLLFIIIFYIFFRTFVKSNLVSQSQSQCLQIIFVLLFR